MPGYECEGYERETDAMEQNSHRVPQSRKMRVASRAVGFSIIINFANFFFSFLCSHPRCFISFLYNAFIVWVVNGRIFFLFAYWLARKSCSAIRSTSTNLCVTPFAQSQPPIAILVDYEFATAFRKEEACAIPV